MPGAQTTDKGVPLSIPCRRTRYAVPLVRTVTQTGRLHQNHFIYLILAYAI